MLKGHIRLMLKYTVDIMGWNDASILVYKTHKYKVFELEVWTRDEPRRHLS